MIKRELVEATVLSALRERLMAPEVYAAFVRGFTADWNAEQKGCAVAQGDGRDELRCLARRIENFVEMVREGNRSPGILTALAEAPGPRLMPNLAEIYREKIAALQEALGGEDGVEAREQIRGLIDEVRLVPSPTDPKAPPAIEVRGELAAMLALGAG